MAYNRGRTNRMGINPRRGLKPGRGRGRGFSNRGGRGFSNRGRGKAGFSGVRGRSGRFSGGVSSLGNTGYKGTFQSPFNYQFGISHPSNQQPYTVTHPWQRGAIGQIATDKLRQNTHSPVQKSYNRGY